MLTCSRSLFRAERVLKFSITWVNSRPVHCFQEKWSYYRSSCSLKMSGAKGKPGAFDVAMDSEVHCSISSNVSKAEHAKDVADAMDEVTVSTLDSSTLQDNVEDKVLEGDSAPSADKHSLSIEIGASVIQFVRGKEGSTRKKIEEEMGVKIIFPRSRKEDSITIEGTSLDSVTRASERIQTIIDEAAKSYALEYSHFVSLPLAIHPELVDKLFNFQNSILGVSDSNEDTSDNKDNAVELKKSSNLSALGIEKSIFNKPKTFHLTVLMLKLWNKDRVNAATEVLKSTSSRVMDALDNRPVFVRLKGLDCMKGSLAKARVLYIPVEEIGDGDRLRRACQVITDAFTEAGLVLEKDVNQTLKLHATVMNASHRKRKHGTRKVNSFDARGIFKQFGSEVWGEFLIREAHLSQRFVYDESSGYYRCCASIPFPESMEVD